jgi:ABC-type sugar transport system ATPase subunit
MIEAVDMDLHTGEVVGVAGLLGSGRTELVNLIFGVETPNMGSLIINGKKVDRYSPLDSIVRGVSLCPENRKEQGFVAS